MNSSKKVVATTVLVVLVIGAYYFIHQSDEVDITGLHIMPNGTVMNGAGEIFKDAEVLPDGRIKLGNGRIVERDILSFPKRGPEDRVEKLEYVMKDGVKEFNLSIDEVQWEYADGKYVHVWAFNGQIPGPEIRVTEGDKVRVVVKNNLSYMPGTTVHHHGLLLNGSKFDGVPGLDQYPIKPGETFTYEYTANNAGTHFYHTHGSNHKDVAMQDDMGLSGAFIIEPRNRFDERHSSNYDKEWVYMLDEWAVGDSGVNHALHLMGEDGEHVHQTANVFTINGRIFPDNLTGEDTIKVDEGDKVLIRLINNGSEAIHPMHTHGHQFELIAIDGNLVPFAARQIMDVITVNPGERRDILMRANNPGTWLFHCHNIHHAMGGMILGFFYNGYEPCCLDNPDEAEELLEDHTHDGSEGEDHGH
ncbi:hypothetical protein CL631_01345 [bacterium]|jgi:FtsP/CotA-like multicopper oxidase with cupredoxin domain|nr:hypothetical protein [bacterium]MDP6659658.1 multicopper oxidase domain-containing protein [Candidatus Paceibacterota bacterium]|tara:strand:+ start:3185 stop:4435 length:1251 start_codon:yes stop_codon:yes gene_type:complete